MLLAPGFGARAAHARRAVLILVVYLLRDVPHEARAAVATTVGSALLVAVLHLWRANALLAIFVYVLATNLLVR